MDKFRTLIEHLPIEQLRAFMLWCGEYRHLPSMVSYGIWRSSQPTSITPVTPSPLSSVSSPEVMA